MSHSFVNVIIVSLYTPNLFDKRLNNETELKLCFSSCYCPTITIVTVEWSIVLTFVSYNEAKRKRKFDDWSVALRRELDFGKHKPTYNFRSLRRSAKDSIILNSAACCSIMYETSLDKPRMIIFHRNGLD